MSRGERHRAVSDRPYWPQQQCLHVMPPDVVIAVKLLSIDKTKDIFTEMGYRDRLECRKRSEVGYVNLKEGTC